jgi:uncharacterized protein (DUF2164 family)
MKNTDRIKITKEKKDAMALEIKNYFLNERDEEFGDLASNLLLDFIIDKIAAEFYNQGVYDSCNYMKDRCEDLLSIQIY